MYHFLTRTMAIQFVNSTLSACIRLGLLGGGLWLLGHWTNSLWGLQARSGQAFNL